MKDMEPEGRELIVQPFSDVVERQIDWAYEARIPFEHVTLLTGRGGIGKSTLTDEFAARWTTGRPLPGEHVGRDPFDVMFYLTEDVPHIVRKRLQAADANLRRVHLLHGKGDEHSPLSVSIEDLPRICEAAGELGCRVLVFDSLKDFTRIQNDHHESDVRAAMEPMKRMARHYGMAVLGVVHLGKNHTAAVDAVLGSVAWRDSARSVLICGHLKGTEGPLGLGVAKCNLAPKPDVVTFSLVSHGDVGAIQWDTRPRKGVTADDLVPSPPQTDEQRSELEHATEFVRKELEAGQPKADNLGPGEVYAQELQKRAKQAGLSWRTVQRAASVLDVRREKDGFQGPWKWSLPPSRARGDGNPGAFGVSTHQEASNHKGSAKDAKAGAFGQENESKDAKAGAFGNVADLCGDSGAETPKGANPSVPPRTRETEDDPVEAEERAAIREAM